MTLRLKVDPVVDGNELIRSLRRSPKHPLKLCDRLRAAGETPLRHLRQDHARCVRLGILDIIRAYDGGGLTLAEARGDIDALIIEAIHEGVADALRELEGGS
jgi:hypothetical protein